MKHYLLFLSLITLTFTGFAQDYSIISTEHKTYFTNAQGYLRGIRIDSVNITGEAKTYYLFRTARTNYNDETTIADTLGGSWQGKYITEDTSSLTSVLTRSGDTVFIKRRAVIGESWEFYNDTTAKHYVATLTGINIMTFAGIFDTVKTIRLTALNGTTTDAADALNGLEMKISKNHGWVEAIDLYLFPYRPSNGFYYDCYLHQSLIDLAEGNNLELTKENLTFKKVNFNYMKYRDVYNFQIGDVFLRQTQSTSMEGADIYRSDRDSIRTKNGTDSFYLYQSTFQSTTTTDPHYAPPSTSSDEGIRNLTEAITGVVYGDTTKMPEEIGCGYYYYYLPDDSSFCYRSYKFGMLGDKIVDNRFGGGGAEPYFSHTFFKTGLGVIKKTMARVYIDGFPGSHNLLWANKGQGTCWSSNDLVTIKDIAKDELDIKLYPNPANDLLDIDLPYTTHFKIILYNAIGSVVTERTQHGTHISINTAGLAPGHYFLKYADKENTAIKKVSIIH